MHFQLTFTHRAAILLVVLLCIVGGWFRLYNLKDASLWIDEGYTINASNAILKHGYPLMDSGEVYGNGHLSNYSVAAMLKLVPLDPFNPWMARLPAALAGIGVIAATYALARSLFGGHFIGLISASFVALMKWEIAWSQQSRGYTMLTLFALLSALFLWRYLQKRRWSDLAIFVAAFVGAWLSHRLAGAFLPALAFIFLAYLTSHRLKRMNFKWFLLLAGGLIILTWTSMSVAVNISPVRTVGYIPIYTSFIFHVLEVISVGALAGIVLGIFDRKHSWAVVTMTALVLLPTLVIIGYSAQLQLRYLFPVVPFAVIASVYGAVRIGELVLPFIPRWARHAAGGAVFILFSLPMLTFIPRTSYALEVGSPQPAFETVFAFLEPLVLSDTLIISSYPHLHRIYLGTDGLWLPTSLTGRWDVIRTWYERGIDRYVGAPAIESALALEELIDNKHGYVIIDNMTRSQHPGVVGLLEDHPKVEKVFQIQTSRNQRTDVYQFRTPATP